MHTHTHGRQAAWRRAVVLAATCILAATLPTHALELSNWTIDGGDGTSTGGTLTLQGTIAQPDAAPPAAGGALAMTGGFWPCAARFPGDANGDVHCDVVDLLALVYSFGLYRGNPGYDLECDFNYDDTVDVVDLLILVDSFGDY